MRKMTKAFQLEPVLTPVKAFRFKGKWFPINNEEWNDKQIFLNGHGWNKFTATMRNSMTDVPNLTKDWTAQDIREVAQKFSLDVAEGLLQGWGGNCYSDQSVGLAYAKHELINMAYFGKVYDEFTNKIHDLSQRFIKHLLLRDNYRFEGAWMYYKEEMVGQVGLYKSIWLSPLQHIDHLIKGIMHVRPMFDPIGFDEMLVKLILARPTGEAMLKRHVSVKDRIKYLTTQKVADDFEKIFEWQEVFHPEVKDDTWQEVFHQ